MEDVSVIKKAAEMNAEHLLTHFDRIADTPDAIPRLRRFILDLAVRGKLVPQDPNDEPASELLKRIAAEKARLVKAGVIRKPKSFEIKTDSPYELPTNWSLVPLGEIIVKHLGGGTPSKNNSDYWNGAVPWASVKDVGKSKYLDETIDRITEAGLENSSSNLIEPGNLLVVTRMGLGKVSINRVSVAINQDLRALILSDLISIDYAYNFFLTYGFEGTGLTVKGIKLEELLSIPFPLPPLAEQHRIVAKVDELMTLRDRLEAARMEREATRDRMATASLARLNAPDPYPATFQNHAAFALKNFIPLTTRPDQIKALRQTILNLAVRGRLVPQDPNDEPASEMLRKIAETRKFLIVERKMKRPKDLLPVENREIHFSIPAGWAITRMGVAYDVRDGTHDSPKYVDKGYPLITSKNLSSGYLSFDDTKLISKEDYIKISQRSAVVKGDILLAMIGSIGNPVIVDTDQPFAIKNVALLKYFDPDYSNPKFLRFFLLNAANEMKALAVGGLQPFVSLNFLRNYPLAIPPLAEQHRIVTKVDKLMAFCDQLEVSLTTSDETRGLLVEALLHETLVQGTPGQARRQVGRPAIYTTQDA